MKFKIIAKNEKAYVQILDRLVEESAPVRIISRHNKTLATRTLSRSLKRDIKRIGAKVTKA